VVLGYYSVNGAHYYSAVESSNVASGYSNLLIMKSGGRVGIGTSVPDYALDINAATGNCLQLIYNDSNGSAATKVGFDLGANGDLTLTNIASKTLVLSRPVYDDLQFPISGAKVPAANYPNWETFTTNTQEYAFDVDEYIQTQANELPHWWKEGTNGDVHVHFTIKTAQSTGANRYVKFEFIFAVADTGDVWGEQTITNEATIPTGSGALKSFYLDMGDLNLSSLTIGAQVKCRPKRIAATGGTEYADSVFITQVGVHLQKDTMGSRTESAK
jgi:hypothetical protein